MKNINKYWMHITVGDYDDTQLRTQGVLSINDLAEYKATRYNLDAITAHTKALWDVLFNYKPKKLLLVYKAVTTEVRNFILAAVQHCPVRLEVEDPRVDLGRRRVIQLPKATKVNLFEITRPVYNLWCEYDPTAKAKQQEFELNILKMVNKSKLVAWETEQAEDLETSAYLLMAYKHYFNEVPTLDEMIIDLNQYQKALGLDTLKTHTDDDTCTSTFWARDWVDPELKDNPYAMRTATESAGLTSKKSRSMSNISQIIRNHMMIAYFTRVSTIYEWFDPEYTMTVEGKIRKTEHLHLEDTRLDELEELNQRQPVVTYKL